MRNEPFIKLPNELVSRYKLSAYNVYVDPVSRLVFNSVTTAAVSFDFVSLAAARVQAPL